MRRISEICLAAALSLRALSAAKDKCRDFAAVIDCAIMEKFLKKCLLFPVSLNRSDSMLKQWSHFMFPFAYT